MLHVFSRWKAAHKPHRETPLHAYGAAQLTNPGRAGGRCEGAEQLGTGPQPAGAHTGTQGYSFPGASGPT